MYLLKISFLAVVFLWTATTDGKFPINPKPCPYGDGECIKNVINFLLHEKTNGYASLNVIKLNPLIISEINIKQGSESPVNIDLKFRNSEMTGIKDAKVLQVKGFGKDIAQVHEILMESETITLLSDYTISGRVLVLPITGSGKSNITMDNVKLKITMYSEPLVKNGETYINFKNLKLNVDTTRLHFHFTNLFNGDKTLGDTMNSFLNENWKDIFGEVRESITSAFATIFQSVINNVFHKYPYDKLFASE